jgi:hydrogenase-4 component F
MNILYLLPGLPFVFGIASFLVSAEATRRLLLIISAVIHLILTLSLFMPEVVVEPDSWLIADALSRLFLLCVSLLFMALAFYHQFSSEQTPGNANAMPQKMQFFRQPEKVFAASLQFFLAAMSLAVLSRHFGLQWIGIEATTLASTPLIYYKRSRHSLEAAWKYLVICSVGISLALLGLFFLAMAMPAGHHDFSSESLSFYATYLNPQWLKIAFLFILVGYGTKMGLAPMHTWLPDAHGEAPALVSALLSGALLNCAFLGILRVFQVIQAAGLTIFADEIFIVAGLLSMATASLFIFHQSDYKRMLAYSSVEHMGILILGMGIGGLAIFAAMLHVVCHSVVKAGLFLCSGNILKAFGSRKCDVATDLKRRLPVNGALWVTGFLAITGAPPFATFLSEFLLLKAALDSNKMLVAFLYVLLLSAVFVGMLGIVIKMYSAPSQQSELDKIVFKEEIFTAVPAAFLFAIALLLTFYAPDSFMAVLKDATTSLGGKTL